MSTSRRLSEAAAQFQGQLTLEQLGAVLKVRLDIVIIIILISIVIIVILVIVTVIVIVMLITIFLLRHAANRCSGSVPYSNLPRQLTRRRRSHWLRL